MKNRYSSILLFHLLLLAIGITPLSAQEQSNQLKAMKWVKRTIQSDINNIIKPTLFRAFTKKERILSRNIDVDVVLDSRVSRVRALPGNGKRKIEISTGFLSLIGHLIDANIISNRFNKRDKLASYNLLISNYMRTYQDRVREGLDLSWPEPFHKYIGIDDETYNRIYRSNEYDQVFSLNMRIVLSYILAHEYAHHILGHLTTKIPRDAEESRRNEDEADDFSIRVNWMLGNNPLPVANYFMLFTMVEGGLHEGTHAPSACRLEKILHAGIAFTESEGRINDGPMSAQYSSAIKQLKKARRKLKAMCENGETMTNTSIPGLW